MARSRGVFVLVAKAGFAAAAPGMSVTEISVSPLDAAKVVAAFDKWMNSATGKQFKGRLLLEAHVADGNDPATHSITSPYHSATEAEAFGKLAQSDPAWTELLNAVVPIAQVQFTGRATNLKNWGDINDTDSVWNVHYFTITDPARFVAALDTWLTSPMGMKSPAQGHLMALGAGGINPTTHIISVGYASMAEMESYGEMVANDPGWIKFLAAIGPVSTHLGAGIVRDVKVWGSAPMSSFTRK